MNFNFYITRIKIICIDVQLNFKYMFNNIHNIHNILNRKMKQISKSTIYKIHKIVIDLQIDKNQTTKHMLPTFALTFNPSLTPQPAHLPALPQASSNLKIASPAHQLHT